MSYRSAAWLLGEAPSSEKCWISPLLAYVRRLNEAPDPAGSEEEEEEDDVVGFVYQETEIGGTILSQSLSFTRPTRLLCVISITYSGSIHSPSCKMESNEIKGRVCHFYFQPGTEFQSDQWCMEG